MTGLIVGFGVAGLVVLLWKIITLDDDWDTGVMSAETHALRYWQDEAGRARESNEGEMP